MLIAAGALLAGCGGSEGALGFAALADSADAKLIHTPVAVWESESPWAIDPDPVVSVGAAEGADAYLFSDVRAVLPLPGGEIAVADGLSAEIRFFDSAGAHLRTVGRVGDGPGEYQALSSLELCAGELHAFDGRLGRLTVLSLRGDLVDSYRLLEPTTERRPYEHRCGPNGQYVMVGWGETPPRGRDDFSLYAQRAPVWIVDDARGTEIQLGTYVTSERIYSVNPQTGGRGSGPHPFGRAVVFSLGAEHVFVGTSERLQVEVRSLDGTLIRVLRGPDLDLSIGSDVARGYMAAEMSRADSLLRDQLVANDMRSPPSLPAYEAFLVDPSGNLWVERFDRWSAQNRWGVFDADGRFLGYVPLPAGFEVHSVGDDAVYGVSESQFGIERVQVYELQRGASGR